MHAKTLHPISGKGSFSSRLSVFLEYFVNGINQDPAIFLTFPRKNLDMSPENLKLISAT